MSRQDKTKHDLRCFCRGQPLLAVYGVDEQRRLYIHVKIYKQSMIYGEIVVSGGPVSIRCRNCLRWHRVVFRSTGTVDLEEGQPPRDLA